MCHDIYVLKRFRQYTLPQAEGGGGQPCHWSGAHGQRGLIFNEQENVLYIILTVER